MSGYVQKLEVLAYEDVKQVLQLFYARACRALKDPHNATIDVVAWNTLRNEIRCIAEKLGISLDMESTE